MELGILNVKNEHFSIGTVRRQDRKYVLHQGKLADVFPIVSFRIKKDIIR